MKQKLTLLLTALLLLTGMTLWGQECYMTSIDLSEQGYENGQSLDGVDITVNHDVTLTFYKGTSSNAPKYYNTGTAVRCYGGNYFTVTTLSGYISGVTLTFGSGDGTNEITTDAGSFESPTWSGNAATVTFTIGGTTGHRRIKVVEVMYCTGGAPQQTVATPTFTPTGGTYNEAQTVSISCTTEGATIRYTTNGNDPTESSSVYYNPLNINETTTVKAKAWKDGYNASAVATATYTFVAPPTLITIAEAKALEANEYAMVQGVVTFIDNRNVYVQDATGGICLYLNNGTVPSELALGDMVQAYGKRANYNGLFELSNIHGGNSDEFSILSSGNALPLAVKTIAEVIAGGADVLQCTRVKIESATLGTINTTGNTPLTQDENTINIYKIPALTGIDEGDVVDVTGVVGYFNAAQIRVSLASDVVLATQPQPNPVWSISATTLSDFSYTFGNGPSEAQSFTVSGSNLTSNVTVTAPDEFEISLSANETYSSSLSLVPDAGTLTATTIYVRMAAGLAAGTYSDELSLVSGSLSAIVNLNGTVNALPTAATPTFSPAEGNYLTAQTVSISTSTENATLYYTLDGTVPTENSAVYNAPITISTTTTLKAMAVAAGYSNSAIATANYTINEAITIAEARVLDNNAYACVEGTVTFIDGRNIYIQDPTAGIDLYLNNNTVPSGLAVGDIVRAYGTKTVYKGLVELSGINGYNTSVFSILSTGNPLPLATQTIAEINSDFSGSNMLQSTRVKIENAVIGAINPSGNTVLTQNGQSINIYHIPAVSGISEGDLVSVTGIISCYNTPQMLVASANDIETIQQPTDANLTASPTTLTGLNYAFEDGGPSQIVDFELGGSNLVGPTFIYPSESFEISTLGGSLFTPENPTAIYSPDHFSGIKIYVRLKADLEVGTYNEQLFAVSENADTLFVNVSGTVTGESPTPPTPGDGNYVRISDLGQLVEGSYVVFAARFNDNATDYYAMSNASSGKPTGVMFISAISEGNEILPASIVDEESSYYWTVGVTANGYTFTNALGELIGYTSSTNFATGGDNTEWAITVQTSEESAMVPNYTGFVVGNVNNPLRAFALNSNHNFGPYHAQNMGSENYNFFLDIFVKTEGIEPPTPVVAAPTFTPESGTYFEAQEVTINCTTDDATIYYSTVSENGPWTAYTAPILVAESQMIWAYAEKEGYDDSPVANATYTIQTGMVTIFNQDWEGDMNGWTFVDVEGEMTWAVATYQGNHYAYANGYNHGANIDWCISPAFNLDNIGNPVLSFRTAKNYTGNDLEVYFSNDYDGEDPTNATWTALACNLSQGGWNWVESGDIDLSSFNGTNCYIGFKYTCEEGSAAGWEVDDILLVGITSEPVVTVTPLALTGFTYTEGNGPSAEQSFTVSGFNLTNNITIYDATDFEISLTSGSGFVAQNTIVLTVVGGNVEETTIYVRMKAGLAVGNYEDEDITISCNDVNDIDVTCSGSVTAQPIPGDDYVRISNVSELMAGNRVILASRYNDTENAYLAIVNAPSGGKLATTEFTSEMNGTDEIIPDNIMADEDNYYWTVGITADGYTFTNAIGDVIGYGNSGTNFVMNSEKTVWTIAASTSEEGALVPNYQGFNIVNATTENRAFALRVTDTENIVKAYATSNMANGEYNFFLDIFLQGEGGSCTVAAPTFSPAGGTYYETQDVTLNCGTADATIYYSLDSENGPWEEYEEAITIDESMTVWAYATKEGCNDSPIVSEEYIIQDDLTIIFWQEWEDDWDPWHGWTEVCQEGDSLWRVASYGGNHYAYANGYNHPPTIDWLISPVFDLDSYSDVVLTFNTAKNYNGPDLEVFFSNDYDGENPAEATWILLPCELSEGGWNWVASGDISLDGFSGSNCYIGFRYTSDEDAAGWEVDDIKLASGSTSPTPTLVATPNYLGDFSYVVGHGPSESQSYVLSGVNLHDEGYIHIVSCSWYEISLDNETFTEVLEFPCTELPATVYVRMMEGLEPNTYDGVYIANIYGYENDYANVAVNVSGIVHYENEPTMSALMPLYIQGNNGSNNNRVPVAVPVQFANLYPNTTYHYTNQFVDENDGPETAGAGNVIYANPEGFYRTTSPSLATEDGYGEFTTDEDGHATIWLMNEPTANARFTPGNHVYMRVRLNDGAYGVNVLYTFTSEDYATVLNFGTENDEYSGTAFYVKSDEAPMSFAIMYDADNYRPIYATSIEATGVDYSSINQYADFYKEHVAGKDGWFGGILPNNNESGITGIVISSLDFQSFNEYDSENGQWAPDANTVNPTNGLDEPIFIDLTYVGVEETVETNIKVWSADHEFVIENGDSDHYQMTVYNVLGQPMMQRQVNAGSTTRFGHNLATGVYIISLRNNKHNTSIKVMVR